MDRSLKLSVIMPVFNEYEYVAFALESILYQNVNFEYEIVVVDDCSNDDTVKVVRRYQEMFDNIIVLTNKKNRGKGYSFSRAYKASSGKYFHVLDGDDFFVSYDKLQKQVDFLDANEDYVAVAHNTAILFDGGELAFVSSRTGNVSYSYEDCINNRFYCHTSAYMYRKIQSELPSEFLENPMRGDTAVFFYHVFKTKKKIMYFAGVESVYNYHESGIWSMLADEEKRKLNIDLLEIFLEKIIKEVNSFEYAAVKKRLDWLAGQPIEKYTNRFFKSSAEDILRFCRRASSKVFEPSVRDKAFSGMHGLQLVDQLCELIGRTVMLSKGFFQAGRIYDGSTVALLVSGFVPNGGGIFREIKELVKMHLEDGKKVLIFSSNDIDTADSIIEEHFDQRNIEYWKGERSQTYIERVSGLIEAIFEAAPIRLYPFVGHNDVVASAAIQRGVAKSIVIDYVYDHGTSLSIFNSSIDYIIVKTKSQADALARVVSAKKLLLIPPFLTDCRVNNRYSPLMNGVLTTASAAARSYKIESGGRYKYHEVIPNAMKVTGGKHYHFGPLSDGFMKGLAAELERQRLPADRFVHIEWAENLSEALLSAGVDLFISPFPVCSARIAIEVMSCGIPLINYHLENGARLPQAADFCDPNQLTWSDPAELSRVLARLDRRILLQKSRSARKYFEENNRYSVVRNKILLCSGSDFELSESPEFVLKDVHETDFFDLDYSTIGLEKRQRSKMFDTGQSIVAIDCPVSNSDDVNVSKGNGVKRWSVSGLIGSVRYKLRIRTRFRNAVRRLKSFR